jgi:hypothetical protein
MNKSYMIQQTFKYFAFISYNSKDTEWGKKVQKKLEHYRMPATLCSEHGWERTPIKPVFFAPTDIQPGGLTEELQDRLRVSKNLIVICSPNSAKSEWVGKEIEFFHQLGRTKQIHFFIVEGEPHSGNPDTDCFNPIVDTLGLPEILGANIHEKIYRWPWMNKERAYVQLISKLLGVEFDAIWQRHKRMIIQKTIGWIISVIAVLAIIIGVWMMNQPVDVEVKLNEASIHNDNLPPLKDAIVMLTLDNETKTDTIHSIDDNNVFTNIPHKFLGKEVKVVVECKDFLPVDTIVSLSNKLIINIKRDEKVYGTIHFTLYNFDKVVPVPNTSILIDSFETKSDDNGIVRLFVPLESQDTIYSLQSQIDLVDSVILVPHSEDTGVFVK